MMRYTYYMHFRKKLKKLPTDIYSKQKRLMKKSKKLEKVPIYTIGSNNLAMDFGFPPEEAVNLTARADMLLFIRNHIKDLKWTQRKASAEYGIPQPRIAEIMSLKIDKFSVDQLLKYLSLMGMTVKIKIEPFTKMKEVFELDEPKAVPKKKTSSAK